VRTIGVSQTNAELRRHLQEQVGFLCRSCDSFDAGHEDEAKRLAAVLRVMLHDTASSKSLLGLLGMLPNLLMYDTASHIHPRNLASTDGLTIMRLTVTPESGADAGYEAPLDEPRPDAPACLRSFSDWWERAAVKDSRGRSFSRRDLVLRVANKDGGSHVDPQLIWSIICQVGVAESLSRVAGSVLWVGRRGERAGLTVATRGQSDMRGFGYPHDRLCVGSGASLGSSVAWHRLLIAVSRMLLAL
jgi:hypothetical protein